MYRSRPIAWMRVLFFVFAHAMALAALVAFPPALSYLPLAFAFYLWMGFATTVYLHRYLTHRGFEMNGLLRGFFFLGTLVGAQGDPITWVGHHRFHHQHSDEATVDVHSPLDGFFYAHMGWIFAVDHEGDLRMRAIARDVADRFFYCRWALNRSFYLLPHLAVAGLLWATLGLGAVAWCLYLPLILVSHVTWSVNSVCHVPGLGRRRYATTDRSRNVGLVGLLALGEGWHNNHHASQVRVAHGLAWYEVDLSKYLIASLEKLGLVWDVRWSPPCRVPLEGEPVAQPGANVGGAMPSPAAIAAAATAAATLPDTLGNILS